MRFLSLCSGIEAASAAWKGLGWKPIAFSEIEPFPCSVLAHHFPDVPNVGDMTQIDGRKYRGTVDLLVGGTPCQGFSIAGKRGGLSDVRSGLAMHFVRLVAEIKPKWFLWENVPGAFSTAAGRDFGTFIRALDGVGYHLAWRVLDAQFFGVPQRRRRIFLVGHSGDWRHPAAVLFEPGCLRRDSQTGGKKRQDVTQALTGCLGAGGADDNRAQAGFYVPEIVSQAMSCKWAKGTSGPAGDEYHNLVCAPLTTTPYADNIAQESKLVISQYGDKAGALTSEGRKEENASTQKRNASALLQALRQEVGEEAFIKWGSRILDSLQSPEVLRQEVHGGRIRCAASEAGLFMDDSTLSCKKNLSSRTLCNLWENGPDRRTPQGHELAQQLAREFNKTLPKLSHERTQIKYAVRRLTPLEAERLQGFPDGWTDVPHNGKPASDSARYKALGNSMAVPVMRWIGERIAAVQAEMDK